MSQTANPAAGGPPLTPDICVVGDAAGGVAVAMAAAVFGAGVVLVRRGDTAAGSPARRLALRAVADRARLIADGAAMGLPTSSGEIDYGTVHSHLEQMAAKAAIDASDERLTALGIRVLRGEPRFLNRQQISVGPVLVKARRFVIAAGATPAIPAIEGIEDLPYLTEDGLYALARRPERLIVLGGSPAAVELAQAMRALGCEVDLVAPDGVLPGFDDEGVAMVRRGLVGDGVAIHEGRSVRRADRQRHRPRLILEDGTQLVGTHLLVASGERPDIAQLDLDLAGVRSDAAGIVVDTALRTANPRIYAIGACAGGAGATMAQDHAAQHQAGLIVRNALFRLPVRFRPEQMPRIVQGWPELATIGLDEARARASGAIRILRWPYADSARARAERQVQGLVKVTTDRKGRILGVVIAGARAAELIVPWQLAIQQRLSVAEFARLAPASQSLSELSQKAALAFQAPLATKPGLRRLVGFLRRFG